MRLRTLLISLAVTLAVVIIAAWFMLPGRAERLLAGALSDDPARRQEALRQLLAEDRDRPGEALFSSPAVLTQLRASPLLERCPWDTLRDLTSALAEVDCLTPEVLGLPAYVRYLQGIPRWADEDWESQFEAGWRVARETAVLPIEIWYDEEWDQASDLAMNLRGASLDMHFDPAHASVLALVTWLGPQSVHHSYSTINLGRHGRWPALARDAWILDGLLRLRIRGGLSPHHADNPVVVDAAYFALVRSKGWSAVSELDIDREIEPLLRSFSEGSVARSELGAAPPAEPIMEQAHWPTPRWQIAMLVEEQGDEEMALDLLRSYDNHVRRAGLLACGMLKCASDEISLMENADDDMQNRRYALLAHLMQIDADDSERQALINAAVAMGDSGQVPADDVLFAMLAAGSTEGMDWLIDPLTPRAPFAEPRLGWKSEILPRQTKTLWPLLQRFFGDVLDIPPNVSDNPRAVHLHTDIVRMWWVLHRRHLVFDSGARVFQPRVAATAGCD